MGPKASGTTLFGHGLIGNPANSNGDEHVFNQLQNCTSGSTTGVFAQQQDFMGRYICSTLETGTVGGAPIKTNDVLTLTITDSALGAANPVKVKVTAVAGDTAITLATKIAQGINNNANLANVKITATATGTDPNVKITTASGNPTTFAFASTGAETMNLPAPIYGANSSLSTFVYNGANNWDNLVIAWPNFFSINAEDYAETFATYSGFTDTTYPDGVSNPTSQDHYILAPSSNGFACSKNIIFTSGNDRLPPSVSSFPTQCPTN